MSAPLLREYKVLLVKAIVVVVDAEDEVCARIAAVDSDGDNCFEFDWNDAVPKADIIGARDISS